MPKPPPEPALPAAFTEEHFINRELSWLAFNERVLEEAARTDLPVLERVKFLAITASNLDEFFMVRVGGLQLQKDSGKRLRDGCGLTPSQQLEKIRERATRFVERQYAILNDQIVPELRVNGIRRLTGPDLTPAQRTQLQDHFTEHLFPVLSPIDVERITSLPALQLALLCLVKSEDGEERQVLFVLPSGLPRQVVLTTDAEAGAYVYVNLEDVLQLFIQDYFPGEEVKGVARFRISRNSDIAVDEDGGDDLATEMAEVLDKRLSSPTIRIELEAGAPRALERGVRALGGQRSAQVYLIPGELDLKAYFHISGLSGFEHLKVEPWDSKPTTAIEPGESIFEAIRRRDILLHHPYEAFDPVLHLLEEAASDPDVVAIKQILYRTARNSRIINALIKAAQSGKHVTVLVELKARFDEERNLERAEDLIEAGAQIVYGVRGLKTHAKICLVMRREAGHMMRYMHFGTGNYNEATSRIYTDISYLTCRPDYGADASAFFNTVTGRSRFQRFERISMAPFGLRERLVTLINSEAERAAQGDPAEIMLKMNALEDREMIEALYRASQAGVKIRLNVRGICCLRPGVKGLSENIRVISIIDRYLEHARIFCFRQGGSTEVFIASADFMSRNLSKRVELLTPIADGAARKRLLSIMETFFSDTTNARELQPDGSYLRLSGEGPAVRSQLVFTKDAIKRSRRHQPTPDTLVPHTPKVEEPVKA